MACESVIAGPAFTVLSIMVNRDISKRALLARMQGLTYLSKLLVGPPVDSSSANLSGTGAGSLALHYMNGDGDVTAFTNCTDSSIKVQ